MDRAYTDAWTRLLLSKDPQKAIQARDGEASMNDKLIRWARWLRLQRTLWLIVRDAMRRLQRAA